MVLGLSLALLVGLSLGILGGGGSILAVPIFVYILGIEPKTAIAMSLAVVGSVSLVGALSHARAGNIDVRVAALFGSVAMFGSFLGARLATLVSGTFQLSLFAVVMLVAAIFMFRGRQGLEERNGGSPGIDGRWLLIGLQGIAVGVLTGLVGVGGGFLIVPALVILARVPMKMAVGTSLLIIAMNASVGFASYLGQVTVDWSFTLGFTAIAIVGILIGSRVSRRIPQRALRKAFAVFLIVMGALILYQNLAQVST